MNPTRYPPALPNTNLCLSIMLSVAFLIAACGTTSAHASEKKCAIGGEAIHWQADYCMYKASTDDFLNEDVQACMDAEYKTQPTSACAAKTRYKKLICKMVAETEPYNGSAAKCFRDKDFSGPTVRNGGVS